MFPRIPCSESRFGGIGNALKHESSIGEDTEKVIYSFTAYHLRTMGRRFLTFCFVALALFLHPLPAVAWGYQGHRMIAYIAMDRLTPEARQNLRELLGNNDLASISTWADDIKNGRPETKPWHYVDIPSTADGYLQLVRKHSLRLAGKSRAAEYRFSLERFPGLAKQRKMQDEDDAD
jgi:hypothetical protein